MDYVELLYFLTIRQRIHLTSKLWTIKNLMPQNSIPLNRKVSLAWNGLKYFTYKVYLCETYMCYSKNLNSNNNVDSNVNFQKIHIPLFLFYSKFLYGRHTNLKLAILREFAEGCVITTNPWLALLQCLIKNT